LKFAVGVQRVRLPLGKGCHPTESESCQCRESRIWKRRQRVLKLCESAPKLGLMLWPSLSRYGGQYHPAELAVAGWRGRGLLNRAKAREDSPGTWETRSAPSDRHGIGRPSEAIREHPGLSRSLPLGAAEEERTKKGTGGTAKRRKRSAAGRH